MNDEESNFTEQTDSTQNSTQQKQDVSAGSCGGCIAVLFFVIMIIVLLVAVKCGEEPSVLSQFYTAKEKLIVKNRIYDSSGITSDGYVDPIHSFFKVQLPLNLKIKPSNKESTFTIPSDSPHSGKVVPASRVTFHNGSSISILARETFVHTLHDRFLVEMDLKLKKQWSYKNFFCESQWIQIDGARGSEHILWNEKEVMHMVKYKKNGLDHSIVMYCEIWNFAEQEKKFQAMLETYQGTSSKD